MNKKQEQQHYVISLYDNYLMDTEQRGISCGEIVYIENLTQKELNELEDELENVYCVKLEY